jgi:hypothetical protein
MSVSLLMRKIERLERELAQYKSPASLERQVSNLNTSTVAIQVPLSASEALNNLKDEISRSSCKNNPVINEKIAFLTSKISGGKRSKSKGTRKNTRKSKKTRRNKH